MKVSYFFLFCVGGAIAWQPPTRTCKPLVLANRVSTTRGRSKALVVPFDLAETSLILASDASVSDYQFEGSYASLYVTLGLFVISFPGIISLVTRSTKVKMDQKTYVLPGAATKPLRQVAAEIMAYFQANNFKVDSAGETIVFKGTVEKSKSQAFFLTFCLFGGLWGLALVLSIQLRSLGPLVIGDYWYLMCLLSPIGGLYYWTKAGGVEEARVRLVSPDDQTTEVTVQASKEELERFASVMDFDEKGKIRVRGIFEKSPPSN